ncbi:hypothetical protein MPTK1_4g12540 [Marchantia polymorpha subsp. ruderalis]|uniref:Uncharacterized protein n=2 Tax=Marchantia polymorpha TaxID=3197 RepID=A0AAF6B979_MARPO|nr:hypothetical protein MARPO_0174s0016 [Marchantia polymorpha]BBN08563.1 hypothetical protein Mp_4g12540 [Marchantia polymorpha subsp. ruderalis]|eukprot:PTQ28089.1 hypothetical protein MARPO_0174s0016 [Marchantia polymorpha]
MDSALTRDRLYKWQSNCRSAARGEQEHLDRRIRVRRLFDMKSLKEIETHDDLWRCMKGRPGWTRQEIEEGRVDYLLISSSRKCWARASLPSHLLSASPEVLQNFVSVVNKFEHAEIFAVWETFKKRPLSPESNTEQTHHDGGGSSTEITTSRLYDLRLSTNSPPGQVPKTLYSC